MPSATQIPVAEYLDTVYHPDREYIDGELRERNVGKWEHSRIQYLLAAWFASHERDWDVIGATERRLRVSATRIRIPDLVVLRPGPQPDILIDPPLLAIEILSPDHIYSDLEERRQDYRKLGVETVWLIDPKTRTGRMCSGREWVAAERLFIEGRKLHVKLDRLFAQLPRPARPSHSGRTLRALSWGIQLPTSSSPSCLSPLLAPRRGRRSYAGA